MIKVDFMTEVNSFPPSVAYMRQWIVSALAQIMVCRLFGAKPLSKPLLGYCQLDPLEQNFSKILIKTENLSFTKMHIKYRLRYGGHFVQAEMS